MHNKVCLNIVNFKKKSYSFSFLERARTNEAKKKATAGVVTNTNPTTNSRQLLIPDESTLSRLVADRLDLPISQRLLDQNFKLSIIKRCWEDQLVLKRKRKQIEVFFFYIFFTEDDFASECDLYMACLILQKQIEHINGRKEKIVIPSIKMKQIREQNGEFLEKYLRDHQKAPQYNRHSTRKNFV